MKSYAIPMVPNSSTSCERIRKHDAMVRQPSMQTSTLWQKRQGKAARPCRTPHTVNDDSLSHVYHPNHASTVSLHQRKYQQ